MKTAFSEYKSDLNDLIIAYKGIRLSDAFINILHRKADKELLKNLKLDNLLLKAVKIYPDRYVKDLFLVRLVSILEEYLKNRLLEEFHKNETSVKSFLLGYVTDRKLTANDVLEGPLKLAVSYLNDILFHNLPKVEKLYYLTFNFDIKKLCNFRNLIIIVKMRHFIIHEGAKESKTKQKVQMHNLQTCLDEINKLVENIEFSISNGRPKKVIKKIDIDGWGKSLFQENYQDFIDYEVIKAWGIDD